MSKFQKQVSVRIPILLCLCLAILFAMFVGSEESPAYEVVQPKRENINGSVLVEVHGQIPIREPSSVVDAPVLREPAVTNIFSAKSWLPKSKPTPAATPQPVEPVVQVPPPVSYRYIGSMKADGIMGAFLTKGDKMYSVTEGDLLDNEYSVEMIKKDVITLRYLPLDVTQSIVIGGGL